MGTLGEAHRKLGLSVSPDGRDHRPGFTAHLSGEVADWLEADRTKERTE